MTTKKKILLGIAAVIILPQFIMIDKSIPDVDPALDIIAVTQPTAEVAKILKRACYDCHSYESTYPWYSNIAPVSWWLKDQINEAREELNFSEWGSFTAKRQDHKLEEIAEEVEEGKMPLESYLDMHDEAILTDEERELIEHWAQGLRK